MEPSFKDLWEEGQEADLIRWIGAALDRGVTKEAVIEELIAIGLHQYDAVGLADRSIRVRKLEQSKSADRTILKGLLWLLGGAGVTACSYSVASAGGAYLITWGAMGIGAFQLLLGLYQKVAASNDPQTAYRRIIVSVFLVVGLVGAGYFIYAQTIGAGGTTQPTPPPDSSIRWFDDTGDTIGPTGLLTFRGTVENQSYVWRAEGISISIDVHDYQGRTIRALVIRPDPNTLAPRASASYSQVEPLPAAATGYNSSINWEWNR